MPTSNPIQKTQGQRYVVEMGDGQTPENFTRVLLLNTSVSLANTFNLEEAELADLGDFDAPYFIDREIRSQDLTLEGSGNVDKRYVADLMELFYGEDAGKPVNFKIRQDTTASAGVETGWTLTAPFIIDNFSIDATYKSMSTCQISLKKAGFPTFVKTVTP